FRLAQQAHDSAAVVPGDTLYFESSSIEYGNLNMTKRLTIISSGWFLSGNPGLQYHVQSGLIGYVTVQASAAGSVLHCNVNTINIQSGANGCRVERCYFDYGGVDLTISSSNNIIIQNFIKGSISLNFNTGNNLIANNIILNRIDTYNLTTSATVSNNVINGTSTSGTTLHNLIFQNNIINKAATYNFVNCTVRNNLAPNTTLPAGDGNKNSQSMAAVFVNPNGSNDVAFTLIGGSNPAVGAGLNGVDCGAYGGASPFVRGLQPAIPAVYQLIVPPTASGASMNVSFSTKSNN
ncbi:MAG TPA: hypothetical protein PKD90_17705, partial [Phnomibacter sp.]|nr:hypothetical protein [Phnomibacter sp.]